MPIRFKQGENFHDIYFDNKAEEEAIRNILKENGMRNVWCGQGSDGKGGFELDYAQINKVGREAYEEITRKLRALEVATKTPETTSPEAEHEHIPHSPGPKS